MIKGLIGAGRGLSKLGLVAAIDENVKGQPSGLLADLTVSSTSHNGANQLKTTKGDTNYLCFVNVHDFRDPWVD